MILMFSVRVCSLGWSQVKGVKEMMVTTERPPLRIKCPASITEPKEKERMAKRVQNRHETVNKRFKQWAILEQPFRHDVINHRDVFSAVVVITQLAIENGEPLFDVHYDDFDFEVEFEEDV